MAHQNRRLATRGYVGSIRALMLGALLSTRVVAAPIPGRAPAPPVSATYLQSGWRDTSVLCTAEQKSAPKASSFGCYRGFGSADYSAFSRHSILVPVRDGTRLAVDVYRPVVDGRPVEGRLPVVFNYSRYWRATDRPSGEIETYAGVLDKGQTVANLDDALARVDNPTGYNVDKGGVALLLSHGYIFVRAEARGTGASFGVRNGSLSGIEAQDGRDIIGWIQQQPWASGKVMMIGGSYEGMSQMLVASTAPQGLVAIFPSVTPFDDYHDVWSGVGVLRKYGLAWLAREAKRDGVQKGIVGSTINPVDTSQRRVSPVDADPDGALREAARRQRLADPDAVDPMSPITRESPAALELVRSIAEALGTTDPGQIMEAIYSVDALEALLDKNPNLRTQLTRLQIDRDDSPLFGSPQDVGPNSLATLAPRIRASGVAVYNWGGWRDFATIDTLQWDANLAAPKKLAMGPWTHGPNELNDMRERASAALRPVEQLRWADFWLKGIDNGIMTEPEVAYSVMTDADRFYWRNAAAWPPAGVKPGVWRLAADAALEPPHPGLPDGQVNFVVDYHSTMGEHTRYHDAIGLGPTALPDLAAHAQRGALAFTSAPFDRRLIVEGPAVADLFITASTPDADVHAYLEKIDAKGVITFLADGVMRGSHRALGKPPYDNLGLPFSDSRRDVVAATPPLNSGGPYEIKFWLQPTVSEIEPGGRLRLVITGADAHTDLTIPQRPATVISIKVGQTHPSSLVVPVNDAF